jgi:single-stranded-DNA-specific exonuclease
MQKRWKILTAEESLIGSLQESLKINRTLCKILIQRGVNDFDKAKNYFRPQLAQLHDPWLMKDMQKAVDRITTAFEQGEKILVFGDYDVDGTTSVAFSHKHLF